MSDTDALLIARWAWPLIQWSIESGEVRGREWLERFTIEQYDDEDCLYSVHAAEAVLIERGLGVGYAHELMLALIPSCPKGVAAIHYATAPLATRVRAMAAVIRAQEASK